MSAWNRSRICSFLLLVLTAATFPGLAAAAVLHLAWEDESDDEDGFKIERKTTPGNAFVQMAVVGADVVAYVDSSVVPGNAYCYRVRAFNTVGDSSYSNEACVTDIGDGNPSPVLLTVTRAGTGDGVVRSEPEALDCGTDCTASYPPGAAVTLTAAPAPDSTFVGWSGGGCSGARACTVTLEAPTTVTATFTLQTYPLTVTMAGAGSGVVDSAPAGIHCDSTCVSTYPSGTRVTLNASAAPGSTFMGWSGGGCSGLEPCTVTVNGAAEVIATFAVQAVSLTVTTAGAGKGRISSIPEGMGCDPAPCTGRYPSGAVVTLTATAAPGSVFVGWSGAECSGQGPCMLTLLADTVLTATFASPGVQIGVFRPSSGTWYLDRNGNGVWDGCAIDGCASFGGPDDKPIVGSWRGDETQQIGLFRTSTRMWYLDQNGNAIWDGCGVDLCLGPFGSPKAQPVAGKWTAAPTAKDQLGYFTPNSTSGKWVLDFNGNAASDDCTIDGCARGFGSAKAMPVVGDWRGAGTKAIGSFDLPTGVWKLDLNGNRKLESCKVDRCIKAFGLKGDLPVVGDWDGSGVTRVGIFDPRTGFWELDLNGNNAFDGCEVDLCLGPFGQAGDVPVAGRWE